MSEFQYLSIGSLFKERTDRFKPEEANKKNLKRLEKIDFSGAIHLSENVKTKTNMILIKKGDLVISGINIEKGAIALYNGDEDILATIHYSSYEFDKNRINIDYFKWFLKSKIFKDIVNANVKGGIKTELKSKKFLQLTIPIPDIDTQIEIQNKIAYLYNEIKKLEEVNYSNRENIKKLIQVILRDAVSGKLVSQYPNDEPASRLLKQILTKKEILFSHKQNKNQELETITNIPYNIPKNWIWCHLEDVGLLQRGKSKHRPRNDSRLFINGKYPFIQTGDVSKAKYQNNLIKTYTSKYNDFGLKQSKLWPKGTLCITIAANIAETGFLDFDACFPDSVVAFVPLIDQSIAKYVKLFIDITKSDIEKFAPSTAQKNINLDILNKLYFPLPPLPEQKRIVATFDICKKLCDEFGARIKENQIMTELLMEAVLKEAFESKISLDVKR